MKILIVFFSAFTSITSFAQTVSPPAWISNEVNFVTAKAKKRHKNTRGI